jgi:hypothetical protein
MEQDIKDRICEQIAEGRSLRAICQDEGMPVSSTVFKTLAADAEFAEQYARAREAQADALFDEVLEIADSTNQADDRRVKIDARKWMAGKLRPKVYGDKIEQTLQGPGGVPLSIAVEWVKPDGDAGSPAT